MKRIALVAALAAAYAAPAFAQSNVTIYGRLNVSVERQKAGGESLTGMVDNSSRIGFRGTEDLGGGLKALFMLEHGFNADTGTNQGAMWGRESWVGLEGGFGRLRLGNTPSGTYFATADYISMHNHDTGTSSDALYAYVMRDTNKISYTTPSLGGLTAELQYSLKETTTGGDNAWEIAANYQAGPLHLGGGYVKFGEDKLFVIRALYEMGAFTFGGYYERDDFDGDKRNNFRLAGMYTMGASEFHLNFGLAGDVGDLDDSGAKQFTLGYNYNLSKRTKLYAFYTRINNENNAAYAPARLQGNLSIGNGQNFSSFAVGVRHNF
ncbi:porin [Caldimonas aquatica]|uniref:Porin n=1 Tax=Caldimonas aquatica TaxID=376175 RepID=A0ABY6MRZ0_9BURK|nr:porin [Schlegelella aquatica]UZD54765.1 porin [Schlegelella aquatica]